MGASDRYAITFEADDFDAPPDERVGVVGVRHFACVLDGQAIWGETTMNEIEAAGQRAVREGGMAWSGYHGRECWGCEGWLNRPPLSPEETARVRAMWSGNE